MNIYLSAPHSNWFKAANDETAHIKPYVLESFVYVKEWMKPYIRDRWHFMLDSGAFTFMAKADENHPVDWHEYVERYAEFINEMNIELFFELDLDNIIGLKEVEVLRAKLEKLTNRQPIPVWHKNRGREYYLKMVDEYKYVAIGGIAADPVYKRKIEPFLPWFISEARKRNTQIHGLGYCSPDGLAKYRFNSVDGTSWLYGNRGGYVCHFNGETMTTVKQDGKTIKNKEVAIHNYKEWLKFQQYAIHNL